MQPILPARLSCFFLLVSLEFFVGISPCKKAAFAAETRDEKKPKENAIIPNVANTTLEVRGKSIKARALPVEPAILPKSDSSPIDSNVRIPLRDIRLFLEGSQIPKWIIKKPENSRLFLVAKDDQFYYLVEETFLFLGRSTTRIRRLAIADGHWLEDLNIQSKIKPGQLETIINVASAKNCLAVLSGIFEEDKAYAKQRLISYRVSFFAPKAVAPAWTQSFPAAGKEHSPGIFFYSLSPLPPQEFPAIQSLVFLEKELLVCAGSVQDVLSLDNKTGKVNWRIERIWELERGLSGLKFSFGPIISRFGDPVPFSEKTDDGAPKKQRVANPEMYQSIIGGPIVVDKSRNPKQPERAIYVAVARGQGRFYGILSLFDCQVYEIDFKGNIQGIVTLPSPVDARNYKIWNNGLVWVCDDGALVRLASVVVENEGFEHGTDEMNCITNIEWVLRAQTPKKPAWLITEKEEGLTTFGEGIAALVPSGGYILEPSSQTFHFPIAIADLNSGELWNMEIKVPFEGQIQHPKESGSHQFKKYSNGKEYWRTMTPFQLTITELGISKSALRVTLGMKSKQSTTVEFPLADIPGLPKR